METGVRGLLMEQSVARAGGRHFGLVQGLLWEVPSCFKAVPSHTAIMGDACRERIFSFRRRVGDGLPSGKKRDDRVSC